VRHLIPGHGALPRQPGSPCVARRFLPLKQPETSVGRSGGSERFLPAPLVCHLSLPASFPSSPGTRDGERQGSLRALLGRAFPALPFAAAPNVRTRFLATD